MNAKEIKKEVEKRINSLKSMTEEERIEFINSVTIYPTVLDSLSEKKETIAKYKEFFDDYFSESVETAAREAQNKLRNLGYSDDVKIEKEYQVENYRIKLDLYIYSMENSALTWTKRVDKTYKLRAPEIENREHFEMLKHFQDCKKLELFENYINFVGMEVYRKTGLTSLTSRKKKSVLFRDINRNGEIINILLMDNHIELKVDKIFIERIKNDKRESEIWQKKYEKLKDDMLDYFKDKPKYNKLRLGLATDVRGVYPVAYRKFVKEMFEDFAGINLIQVAETAEQFDVVEYEDDWNDITEEQLATYANIVKKNEEFFRHMFPSLNKSGGKLFVTFIVQDPGEEGIDYYCLEL